MHQLALLIGFLMDKVLGDPAWLPHPIVAFGKWISFWEHRLNHGGGRWMKGAALAVLSIVMVLVGSALLLGWLKSICPWVAMALETVAIFFCLAGTTLVREVRMVFEATERSLEEGRTQVARIVGRNTEELSRDEIHTAALETLAENLSDGVVAPLFWLAVLGVPGMLTYKMVNTLDSMIGYHSERYLEFGCWAARIDDVFNFIPARLTALLMVVASQLPWMRNKSEMSFLEQVKFVLRYGPQHASPNSGWPEAALASALDCRFGGPHYYFGEYFPKPYIGHTERMLDRTDMQCATRINTTVEVMAVLIIMLVI